MRLGLTGLALSLGVEDEDGVSERLAEGDGVSEREIDCEDEPDAEMLGEMDSDREAVAGTVAAAEELGVPVGVSDGALQLLMVEAS